MGNYMSLVLAFLEMIFIFIVLLVLFQQRRAIGRAAFYLAFGFLQFFAYFVIAADVQGRFVGGITFSVGEIIFFLPLLAGVLMVYITRGTLVAQHLIIAMVALFGLYLYVCEITILQCSWEDFTFAGGVSAPVLDMLLRSGRTAMNETVLRQLFEVFTVPIFYSHLERWRVPRWLCVIGGLAASQLIGLAIVVLIRIGVIDDLPYFIGEGCVRLCGVLVLGSLLGFYVAKLEQEKLAVRSSPLDIVFAFFGSYGRSKELETSLREWTDRYRLVLENAAEAVLMIDDSGRISDANGVAAKLFGFSESGDLAGRKLLELMNITKPENCDLEVADGATVGFSAVVRPKSKRERMVSGTLSSLTIHKKRYRTVICRDVTEETRLARERAELAEQLLHSQRLESLGILAGGVAHDFNNYIHAILGHVDVINLMHPPENAEQARHLDKIAAIAEQAGKLTSELLGFARKGRYKVERLKIRALLDDLLEMIGPQKLQAVEAVFDFPDGDFAISADRVQIQQVMINLVLNALDAMRDNPPERPRKLRIAFGAEPDAPLPPSPPPDFKREGEYLFVSVSDTGCGMDDATKKRIFEPFFTTKPIGSGTGMGLAMAYGTVSNHRGWIQLESAKGEGSTFVLFLPRTAAEDRERAGKRGTK